MTLTYILIIGGALLFGGLASQIIFLKLNFVDVKRAEQKGADMIENSQTEAAEITDETTKKVAEINENTIEMEKQMKTLITAIEENITFKEEMLERKTQKNEYFERALKGIEGEISFSESQTANIESRLQEALANILGVKLEDLKRSFISDFTRDLEAEIPEKVQKLVEITNDNSTKIAKDFLKGAMQKFVDETSVEKNEAKIIVLHDEVKAAIVGPDARNIMLFEELLGVDVIFNDEPKTIHVSCYDLLRKNIARIALEELVKHKKITETTVREAIDSARLVLDKDLVRVGEKVIKKMGFTREFPPKLIKVIGRLKYRTSYGQNILLHSIEVAYMAEMLASELGLNTKTAKIAGFFHDIGKAIDQQVEGSHDVLTREIMTKYGCFSQEEIHAAWTHHEAAPPETPEARLVMAGDAISAGRPGARQESIERYVERLRALEEIATSFPGVKKTYAISAGREIRVIISPEEVADEKMHELTENIAQKIENQLSFPGRIKVNVIRRTRSVDFAK
ncbi:DUF3552 domain-containing protein [Patescibacteria group bacterium]|nr:DUF3552 domain-containing protein [Patescibacteria group bacterium]